MDAAVRELLHTNEVPRHLMPKVVAFPVAVPPEFDFLLPRTFPLEKVTARVVQRQLRGLDSTKAEVRRAAASHVGGWPSMDVVDSALGQRLGDEDLYTRALCALALALHRKEAEFPVMRTAEGVVSEAVNSGYEWRTEALVTAVLAAVAAATVGADGEQLAKAKSLIRRMGEVPSLGPAAEALVQALESGSVAKAD